MTTRSAGDVCPCCWGTKRDVLGRPCRCCSGTGTRLDGHELGRGLHHDPH
jgi:hypothetical protein